MKYLSLKIENNMLKLIFISNLVLFVWKSRRVESQGWPHWRFSLMCLRLPTSAIQNVGSGKMRRRSSPTESWGWPHCGDFWVGDRRRLENRQCGLGIRPKTGRVIKSWFFFFGARHYSSSNSHKNSVFFCYISIIALNTGEMHIPSFKMLIVE